MKGIMMVDPKTFIRMAQAGSEIAFREIVDKIIDW